ncbi:tetratricopeptide repeat protein [Chryseobacterium arthrosphaerae]|uniref:tetratricopeptide repeat protein n=1 Tax=Chryseobacterium arthrosphaerae TaxID=651561 RepID=UPI000F50428D|nr:tetratricopeptide repeat protein [Chryseobacterium arthrosphaerae]AYZ11587.1 tetratricopeptide repeat protein [Chryseobacterium arthrosphaerae]
MIRIFLLVLLIVLVSCHSHSQKEREKNFDIPLMTKNERLRLSGEYDSLVSLNKQYYKKAEQEGYEDGKALCYINLAQINISLENYQKSKILFDNAGKILKDSESNIHKAIFYNNYGRLNNELGRRDKALEYNNTALSCIQKVTGSQLKNTVLYNVYIRQGEYYVQKEQYKKALEYFNKARKFDDTGIADCAISDYVYMHKNKDSAYKYITKAYNQMSLKKREDAITLNIHTIMGEYYLTYGQPENAEKEFLRALEIDKKTRRIFSQYTKYIYNDLRTLYDRMGNKEKAYFYLNAYTEAKSRTNTALLAKINQDMQSFITLTEENTEKHKNNLQWVILFSIAGLSLLGIYAWRVISLLRKRKKDLKLEAEQLKTRMNDNKQDEIIELGRSNDPDFLNRFKEVYPGFIDKLLTINSGLENSELVFCAMLKLHFTSKEIANYTLVQHRTVQQKKYRIRKKLNIPGEIDTYDFFDALG